MDIIEYVMKTADANYVPIKYRIVETSIGANAAGSYLWVKVVGYGMDSKINYDNYVNSIKDASFTGVAPTGLQGTIDSYEVIALSTVKAYKSVYTNHSGPYKIG
jgi:hypothetical protein